MSRENVKLLAAYMTAHTDEDDESIAIGHSVMNKIIGGMFTGDIADTAPALEGKEKEAFFKILNAQMDKDTLNRYKKNLIKSSSIMSGRIKDPTGGADSFSSTKVPGSSYKTKKYNFYNSSQAEGVTSGKLKTKSGKSRKTLKG